MGRYSRLRARSAAAELEETNQRLLNEAVSKRCVTRHAESERLSKNLMICDERLGSDESACHGIKGLDGDEPKNAKATQRANASDEVDHNNLPTLSAPQQNEAPFAVKVLACIGIAVLQQPVEALLDLPPRQTFEAAGEVFQQPFTARCFKDDEVARYCGHGDSAPLHTSSGAAANIPAMVKKNPKASKNN